MEYYPPPFFKQGPSARARLLFFSILAVVLLVTDAHWSTLKVVRQVVATVLYPVQVAVLAPVSVASGLGDYFSSLSAAQREAETLRRGYTVIGQSATQLQHLTGENARLRALLELRESVAARSLAGEILYDARDPFSRKVVISRGGNDGLAGGEPVIDEDGVVGQITRVFPFSAEVTLLTDKDQAIPVQVVRSGVRSIAYGNSGGNSASGTLDLRFIAAHADVREGDVLVTSGIDGIYPAGLAVARVSRIERNAAQSFARIACVPLGGVDRHRHVLILLVENGAAAQAARKDAPGAATAAVPVPPVTAATAATAQPAPAPAPAKGKN